MSREAMIDRELLEAAARAAKYDFIEKRFPSFPSDYEFYLRSRHPARTSDYPVLWNPLENDGDALRLAVKLKIDVSHTNIHSPQVHALADGKVQEWEDSSADPYSATRRAIVRAAAQVARGKK